MAVKIDPIEYWVQRTIPQVYDDSMSFQELLAAVLAKLNEVIEETNAYFDKDLKIYTEEILKAWDADGTLDTVINDALFQQKADKTYVDARFNERELQFVSGYGAKGDGVTINSVFLSNIITDAITKKKTIKIPAGTYLIDASIVKNLDGYDLTIEGEGKFNTVLLWRGGAATMFDFTNGRNVLFKDLTLTGRAETDLAYFNASSIGIKAAASLIFENVYFNGFGTLTEWAGGYYHKFINCEFRWSKLMFKGFNANNMSFYGCKVQDFETFVEVVAGSGPVSFIGGSIEKWVGYAFRGTSGSAAHLIIMGTYFENYPNLTPPTGITGDYKAAFVASGFGSIVLEGNQITCNGIRRVIFGTTVLKHVMSKGNRIDYKSGTGSDLEWYVYQAGTTLETMEANDIAYNILVQTGAYTSGYLSNLSGLKQASSRVYDPFTKQALVLAV